jgi:hypothetical protein
MLCPNTSPHHLPHSFPQFPPALSAAGKKLWSCPAARERPNALLAEQRHAALVDLTYVTAAYSQLMSPAPPMVPGIWGREALTAESNRLGSDEGEPNVRTHSFHLGYGVNRYLRSLL